MIALINQSIARRLNLIILTVIACCLGVFSFVIGSKNYNDTITAIKDKAMSTLDLASIALEYPLYEFDQTGLEKFATAILLDKDVVAIAVTDPGDSSLLYKKQDDIKSESIDELKSNPDYIFSERAIKDSKKEGNVLGKVAIVLTKKKAQLAITETRNFLVLFAFIMIAVTAIFITIAVLRIVRAPITKLRASAFQLSEGNLDAQIDTGRSDELGSLACSFDTMRQSIRRKISDLNKLNFVSETLALTNAKQKIIDLPLRTVVERFKFSDGALMVMNDENEQHGWTKTFYCDESQCHLSNELDSTYYSLLEEVRNTGKLVFSSFSDKSTEKGEGRALLAVPMMDGDKLTGIMLFTALHDVKISKEEESYIETISRLTFARLNNLKMMEVIEEYNRTLEEKVSIRTEELRLKTVDINAMLQNMKQGIFTVTNHALIHPEYSAYLETLLETKDIANRNVHDIIFSKTTLGRDICDQITCSINAIIGEDQLSFELNSGLLPTACELKVGKSVKELEMDWNPILNGEIVEKLIASVRDVTELRKLQEQADSQKRELEIIGEILSVSRKDFANFIGSAQNFLKENSSLISRTKQKDPNVITVLFRNMHTIKGNARTLGFRGITDAVHQAEQTYDGLRLRAHEEWDDVKLIMELKLVEELIGKYEGINDAKLGSINNTNDGVLIDRSLYQAALGAVRDVDLSNTNQLSKALNLVRVAFDTADTYSIEETLKGLLKAIPVLAVELGKPVPKVEIDHNNVRIGVNGQELLRNIFTHTLRNTLDHGFETKEERKAKGKHPSGTISLKFESNEQMIVITQQDDGAGLNLAKIKEKAVEKKLIDAGQQLSADEIANLIFCSGLSTSDKVTQISGRGVGMDAIKNFIEAKGGNIEIVLLNEEKASPFMRSFKLQIFLPKAELISPAPEVVNNKPPLLRTA